MVDDKHHVYWIVIVLVIVLCVRYKLTVDCFVLSIANKLTVLHNPIRLQAYTAYMIAYQICLKVYT